MNSRHVRKPHTFWILLDRDAGLYTEMDWTRRWLLMFERYLLPLSISACPRFMAMPQPVPSFLSGAASDDTPLSRALAYPITASKYLILLYWYQKCESAALSFSLTQGFMDAALYFASKIQIVSNYQYYLFQRCSLVHFPKCHVIWNVIDDLKLSSASNTLFVFWRIYCIFSLSYKFSIWDISNISYILFANGVDDYFIPHEEGWSYQKSFSYWYALISFCWCLSLLQIQR